MNEDRTRTRKGNAPEGIRSSECRQIRRFRIRLRPSDTFISVAHKGDRRELRELARGSAVFLFCPLYSDRTTHRIRFTPIRRAHLFFGNFGAGMTSAREQRSARETLNVRQVHSRTTRATVTS